MKIVIFIGGAGTRLWPLSRKKNPKQFEKIIGNKSTAQLTIERLLPDFKKEDIYISTNAIYEKIVRTQLPQIPKSNFIFEPEKKDVGPAIALVAGIFTRLYSKEPMLILWGDHFIKNSKIFKKAIKTGINWIRNDPQKIIFLANRPRFASVNLGYIHLGKEIKKFNDLSVFSFEGFKYRPDKETAEEYLKSKKYAWNLGYFITTPNFIYKAYQRFAPNIYNNTEKILRFYGKKEYDSVLKKEYSKVESINFDNAILENLDKREALVISGEMGWSDLGAWEAVKEALEGSSLENVIKGNVYLEEVRDSLVYNLEEKKLVVGLDLNEMIIVNTKDALLVTKKMAVNKLQKLVKNLEKSQYKELI
ncbi:MAG: sugar phosphate nucleotidyltransferase [Patescibacteria group bacterium]|nr:sugar phosphate nucleotidyltransferase [Patescibacteria group bacterium]